MIATYSIVIQFKKLLFQDGRNNEHLVGDFDKAILANQRRMKADPFEAILLDMGYTVRADALPGANRTLNQDDSSPEEGAIQCRTS